MKMTKKKLILLIGGAVLAVALVVAGVFGLRNVGAGKSADRPVKLSSSMDVSGWLGENKKVNKNQNGTYYMQLTGDVSLKKEAVITGGNTVYLDLNGHTLSGDTNRAFSVSGGGKLILFGGTVETKGADADGGVIWVNGEDCALTLENVTLTNTDDSHIVNRVSGGVIYIASPGDSEKNAVLTLKTGTRINGSPSGLRRGGGSIAVNGSAKLVMEDGEVTGGKAGISGNIQLEGKAQMDMLGGTVSGGTAVRTAEVTGFGGNINAQSMSRLRIYGGTVTGGKADDCGGNIYVANTAGEDSGLYIFGGTVEGGVASFEGGNIYGVEKVTRVNLYGGEISGGEATLGGNVSIHSGALELWGTTLTGLGAESKVSSGGNIYTASARVDIYGGLVDQGVAGSTGGNIYVYDTEVNIYGGKISRGGTVEATVAAGGANLYAARNSTVNLYGGEICEGVANFLNNQEDSAAGANVTVAGTTFMQMFGGIVRDGTVHGAISRGGGIYVYGQGAKFDAVLHMYGGTVSNGLTDNKMRGMCIGAYSSTNDNTGKGTARIFGGEILYTGPADSPDKVYTIHGNKTNKTDAYVFDPTGLEGMTNRTTLGPCKDASHHTLTAEVAATCLIQGYKQYTCNTCGVWCEITAQPTGHTETTEAADHGTTKHSCSACEKVWYTTEE